MKRLNGFSLVEMMIVLLIVAIIAAATAPMVNRKTLEGAAEKSPWVWTNGHNIAYNLKQDENQTAVIGDIQAQKGINSRLYIRTRNTIESNDIIPQITFATNVNDDKSKNLHLIAGVRNNIWFTNATMANSTNIQRSVVIGNNNALTNGSFNVVIGNHAQAQGPLIQAAIPNKEPLALAKLLKNVAPMWLQPAHAAGESGEGSGAVDPLTDPTSGGPAGSSSGGGVMPSSSGSGSSSSSSSSSSSGGGEGDGDEPGGGEGQEGDEEEDLNDLDPGALPGAHTRVDSAIAIGNQAEAGANQVIAIGNGAKATQSSAISIGTSNNVDGDSAIALGSGNVISNQGAIALGNDNEILGDNATAIGTNARASRLGVAIGSELLKEINAAEFAVAIGTSAEANGNNSIAIGREPTVTAENAIAIGRAPTVTAENAIAIGRSAGSASEGAIGIGNQFIANAADIAENLSNAEFAIAIGNRARVAGTRPDRSANFSIAIGNGANTRVGNAIAIGNDSIVEGSNGIAIGSPTNNGAGAGRRVLTTAATSSVAIGADAQATVASSVAIGVGAQARAGATETETGSVALGAVANATGDNSVAIGAGANATGDNSVALGAGAQATRDNQIVLGTANSTVYIPGKLVVDYNTILCREGGQSTVVRAYRGGFDKGRLAKLRWSRVNDAYLLEHEDARYSPEQFEANFYQSDRRLKNVGKAFVGGLEEIKKLEVFNYTYKKDKTKTPHVGVIAQDLQKIFPDAVFKGEDGFFRIRMEDMFYAVVNAIKELDLRLTNHAKQIDELKKENQELKMQNQELVKSLESIEKRLAKLEKNK